MTSREAINRLADTILALTDVHTTLHEITNATIDNKAHAEITVALATAATETASITSLLFQTRKAMQQEAAKSN